MLRTLVWALVNTFEYLEACIILSATTTGNNHSAAATTDATRGERFIKTMQLKGLKCNSCHILHLPRNRGACHLQRVWTCRGQLMKQCAVLQSAVEQLFKQSSLAAAWRSCLCTVCGLAVIKINWSVVKQLYTIIYNYYNYCSIGTIEGYKDHKGRRTFGLSKPFFFVLFLSRIIYICFYLFIYFYFIFIRI